MYLPPVLVCILIIIPGAKGASLCSLDLHNGVSARMLTKLLTMFVCFPLVSILLSSTHCIKGPEVSVGLQDPTAKLDGATARIPPCLPL